MVKDAQAFYEKMTGWKQANLKAKIVIIPGANHQLFRLPQFKDCIGFIKNNKYSRQLVYATFVYYGLFKRDRKIITVWRTLSLICWLFAFINIPDYI
ncbi:hypothetical protein NBRC116592_20440 [Colwellia sp. KU-HH00111]|uniref:hypothetical protein n=1 Tax=Colwellia sp. KU-HH00111 TaxID=3127652 RepID=UPI00310BD0E7